MVAFYQLIRREEEAVFVSASNKGPCRDLLPNNTPEIDTRKCVGEAIQKMFMAQSPCTSIWEGSCEVK